MENGEPKRRLSLIILAAALADGLVVGGALFFVWMATRGASGGPAAPGPTPETGGNAPATLIWLPLFLALLMPLTTLPVILLLRRRAPGEASATIVRRLIAGLGGLAEAQTEEGKTGGRQNRVFILLAVAMGVVFLLAFAALYIFLLQAQ